MAARAGSAGAAGTDSRATTVPSAIPAVTGPAASLPRRALILRLGRLVVKGSSPAVPAVATWHPSTVVLPHPAGVPLPLWTRSREALVAAGRTAEGRRVHSLHAYFLRPGDPSKQIVFEVDPIRDGRSFTTRRVVAKQDAKAIFSTSVSFQKAEDGLKHQATMPEVPPPEALETDLDFLGRAQVDGDAAPVISGRTAGHARRILRQARDRRKRPTQLEGADRLHAFELQPELLRLMDDLKHQLVGAHQLLRLRLRGQQRVG